MVGSLETRYIELLAIHIDYRINFSGHVSELCKKVSKKVGILMCLHNLIPCLAKLTIYKCSILLYLSYLPPGIALWQALHSKKMECLQERAWRAVYRTKSASYQTVLKISGLATMKNRRLQDMAQLMYKIKNSLALPT